MLIQSGSAPVENGNALVETYFLDRARSTGWPDLLVAIGLVPASSLSLQLFGQKGPAPVRENLSSLAPVISSQPSISVPGRRFGCDDFQSPGATRRPRTTVNGA